jgi:hypothetical protein
MRRSIEIPLLVDRSGFEPASRHAPFAATFPHTFLLQMRTLHMGLIAMAVELEIHTIGNFTTRPVHIPSQPMAASACHIASGAGVIS